MKTTQQYLLFITSALCAMSTMQALALPQGGKITQGTAGVTISGAGLTVTQDSDRAVVDWSAFDIAPSEAVHFSQPSAASAILNRIHDHKASVIDGKLTANGQVYLVNPNGMVFGKGAKVDVAGLVATTADIADTAFMAGDLRFDTPGNPNASIVNQGTITASDAGLAVLVAPTVRNDGVIIAHEGKVALGGGDVMTLDLYGDDLLHLAVSKKANQLAVRNTGYVSGHKITMNAASASHVLSSVVNTDGVLEASTARSDGRGGIILGGEINIAAPFVSIGGKLTANGRDGGSIRVRANSLSLADTIEAKGTGGKGGKVDITSSGLSMANSTSSINVSGTYGGGTIHHESGKGLITSGHYNATSTRGEGGKIDVTANTLVSLSASFDASGHSKGGRIRIGGEYQGGKNLAMDELKNAQTVSLNNATSIKAQGTGASAAGGEAVVWSDVKTIMAGVVDVSPSFIGTGGKVELSSADTLLYGGRVNTGRGGSLLLDPKNITIGSVTGTSTFSAVYSIFGADYSGAKSKDVSLTDSLDYFGFAAALSGTRLAVGAYGDDGANDSTPSAGAVYLFNFADTSYSSATLEGIIGKDYTGGKNVDITALESNDSFGSAVSLDGNRLAVGAPGDDGFGNAVSNAGAAYVFSFVDSSFNGATLEGVIGKGYTGGKNVNVTTLEASDNFGQGASLDGNRLAIGAPYDDGTANSLSDAGAVYLFSFTDAAFNGAVQESLMGKGYTGGKNLDMTAQLGTSDQLGWSLSMDGNRLAAGARADDAAANGNTNAGSAYLFTFSDAVFSGATLQSIIGSGYTGGNNYNLTLDTQDLFGSSLSLDGNRLVVGSPLDDAFGNLRSDAGAAYLFTFSDASFSTPALQATMGYGYTGGKNINVTTLEASDQFGYGISLDGNFLAVGAYADDGGNNLATDTGAISIYSFTDSVFSGGNRRAIIGKEYTGGGQTPINIGIPGGNDQYGYAVSLNGTQLAIGAPGDDGYGNSSYNSGAVYLFTFADTTFKSATLQSLMGKGYTGGKNIDVSSLTTGSAFGTSVSLDSNRLAVGAPGHDGTIGAAYLFSFSDAVFSGGTQEAVFGSGYTGGKNFNVTNLGANDQYGYGISLDGTRLAVSAISDDGFTNATSGAGAVYLYTFTDAAFNGVIQQAIIGSAYVGGKNYNLTLGANDLFGSSISLDGNRLASGARTDDGNGNSTTDSGAVYLFSFADATFTTPTLQATLGKGYTGGKNIDVTSLDASDQFGSGLDINGNRLAVGTPMDDGPYNNNNSNSGAVYLYTFSDAVFSGGALQGTVGYNYAGGKNINVPTAISGDQLGLGVALDGNRLAIGAFGSDGLGNQYVDTGSVYLYSFTDAVFSGASRLTQIAKELNGGAQLATPVLPTQADWFASAVALDGTRLAIGSPGDDGFGNTLNNVGSVYLFTFTDTAFNGGSLQSTIGKGYTGGKNINLDTLLSNDQFGASVSLDGNRLAVGAPYRDSYRGSVYLFTFSDAVFNGGALASTLGYGYTGTKDVNLTQVGANDRFGSAVSLDGTRLAVGAQYDDGSVNVAGDSGSAYLFTFSDTVFNGGSLQSTIGKNYTGGKNYNLALDNNDWFGSGIELDGNRLAIGASGDDDPGNGSSDTGAVYLFSFTDSVFNGATLESTIGKGYTGGKNIDVVNLGTQDYFGTAASLNGNRLAVGAYSDDGQGNVLNASGAIYLFSFTDAAFNGGTLESTIGKGYTGGKNYDFSALTADDQSGWSVSLDGNRLAIGARYDDGVGNNFAYETGAVHLFSFSDAVFSGPTLEATIGYDYTGGKNVSVPALETYNTLGFSVALDGTRLAIGLPRDSGANKDTPYAGAVYLFSFADTSFNGGTLESTIGKGYTGGKNYNLAVLERGDQFGQSLSLDGNRLAVGAYGDDASANAVNDSGAAYLFSFSDAAFSSPTLEATLGRNYTGGKNLNIASVNNGDSFGRSVSLDGNRLAVGAYSDDASGDATGNAGAVYLFTFTDASFNGGVQEAIIGKGYTGGKNYNLTLDANDFFGISLSLDGNRLAVGAHLDNGAGNAAGDTGAVYLFSFADAAFTTPTLQATLGKGYTGGKNINVNRLDNNDQFGIDVSLSGNSLAIGANLDDGEGESTLNSGAIYLYTFTDAVFSGGAQAGIIGNYYKLGKNIDISDGYYALGDQLGTSVSLDGTRLAAGTPFDDGYAGQAAESGKVSLFSFTDTAFSGGRLLLNIGPSYNFGSEVAAANSESYGYLGSALSLDGTRLAIGAPYDNGFGNTNANTGAVYLFSFSDTNFNGGALQSTIGKGYTGGKNVNMSTLVSGDQFGSSVSLDGTRLAVGAQSTAHGSGAAYLFSFTDTAFTGGTLEATLGNGFTGGKNVDVPNLEYADFFGNSVSLNSNRLAVGALQDDGFNRSPQNYNANIGAVYLFSFTDAAFNGGTQEAIMGYGYTGGKNVDLSTGNTFNGDQFGSAISLDGNRLAVGARTDGGFGNNASGSGSVYLYTFSDSVFNGATQEAIIGKGYTGGKNYNLLQLDANDNLGWGVSLDGNRLAVGSGRADGLGNGWGDSGEIYLFTFADAFFNGAALQSTIGRGYTGSKDIDLPLSNSDTFGEAVSLDGNRLAVGASRDDSYDNSIQDSGAIYLFSFSDAQFSSPSLLRTIGAGYNQGVEIAVTGPESSSQFGYAVSMDGNRMVVGAPTDDGFGNANAASGAVYLFSFADDVLNGATLEGMIGNGFSGGKNVNISTLSPKDQFGSAVSLDGNRLAVGAQGDANNAGAVYLFSFTDSVFNGGTKEAVIGNNYSGGKNITVSTVAANDLFGSAVSLDGNRLAVGAYQDDASANSVGDSGAVYLFSFTDAQFSGGVLEATIGRNYTGGKNYDHAILTGSDQFGSAVSLDGNRLAVGTWRDDGSGNVSGDSGAVYLFSFADSTFTSPALQATIGKSYTGGKNIDVTNIGGSDLFGSAVALSGTRLAVGAELDDGNANAKTNAGAVYLFSFTDTAFNGGTQEALFGHNYTGGKNVDLSSSLDTNDNFGYALSLDGTHLAIGAPFDDGYLNKAVNSGAVYIFSEAGDVVAGASTFANAPAASITITPNELTNLLNAGTSVTLQASNDITVNAPVVANNIAGNGGNIFFQAGRSILLNASITTDNGNLTLTANDTLAHGVVDAQRDAGAASITFASGVSVNAGTGNVTIELLDGAGKTFSDAGDITLGSITANTIFTRNYSAVGDITLRSGTSLAASGAGTNTTLVSGRNFINNAGASPLNPGTGRALIYSTDPSADTLGGLPRGFKRYSCSYSGTCPAIPATGNGFLYSLSPTITVTASDTSRQVGFLNPAFSAAYTGYIDGDAFATVFTGAPALTTAASAGSPAGPYTINAAAGTLANDLGYNLAFANGTLTVTSPPPGGGGSAPSVVPLPTDEPPVSTPPTTNTPLPTTPPTPSVVNIAPPVTAGEGLQMIPDLIENASSSAVAETPVASSNSSGSSKNSRMPANIENGGAASQNQSNNLLSYSTDMLKLLGCNSSEDSSCQNLP